MGLALWQPLDPEQVGVATFVLASGKVDTWTGQQITASTIAPLITPSTKAISVVHLGGWPADMPRSSSWPVPTALLWSKPVHRPMAPVCASACNPPLSEIPPYLAAARGR